MATDPFQATPAGDFTAVAYEDLPYSVAVYAEEARTAAEGTDGRGFPVPKGSNAAHFVIISHTPVGTPDVDVIVEGYDKAADAWYELAKVETIVGAATNSIRIWPGALDAAVANVILPERIRVRTAHADADSLTYSVGVTFSTT